MTVNGIEALFERIAQNPSHFRQICNPPSRIFP
jgi:hypothetical protein